MSKTDDPYKYFRVEAREILEQLETGALDLEKGEGASDVIARLLRLAHTLKGAARVVGQVAMAESAHAIEDVLSPLREDPNLSSRHHVDSVLSLLDEIRNGLANLRAPQENRLDAPAPKPTSADEFIPSLKMDHAELDALVENLSNVHAGVEALRYSLKLTERLEQLASLLAGRMASPRQYNHQGADGTIIAKSISEDIRTTVFALEQNLRGNTEHLERELRQLRESAENLRLAPASVMFGSLERTARDTAQLAGKQIQFEALGGDVRLDANVLIEIQRALIQAVRNAVVHGIETAEERTSQGKSPAGRLIIDVSRRRNRVAFRCIDDGGGIDLEAVRRIVRQKYSAAGESPSMEKENLLRLLLKGGLTTSGNVTETSGRGVGLDVVRETVTQLRGEASIHTDAGLGTTLELLVPVSLSSVEALLLEASGVTGAIPVNAVQQTFSLRELEITQTEQGRVVLHDNKMIPFLALSQVIGEESTSTRQTRSSMAVVLHGESSPVAIGVDRLLGMTQIVYRPLPAMAAATSAISGASLDTQGNPQLVFEPVELAFLARRKSPLRPSATIAPHLPVLVIDDSLTTRMLEQSILESAGYEVHLAQSAEEALTMAHSRQYGLFLVDVEMPGMDGFEFVRLTRLDATLGKVPAILVTSRDAPEDRRKGSDSGASAYIVKSEFDQIWLLETIRKLQGKQ